LPGRPSRADDVDGLAIGVDDIRRVDDRHVVGA